MNVANSVTYLSQDFKLQGGKVGNGGSHFNGQRIVGRSVFVEGTAIWLRLPPIFPYSAINLSNSGKQFIIDRGHGNNGANGRPCNGLPDKLGLAHVIVFQPLGKVGVFFLGHAGFDHMAAVGRIVFFLQAMTSFLARQGA